MAPANVGTHKMDNEFISLIERLRMLAAAPSTFRREINLIADALVKLYWRRMQEYDDMVRKLYDLEQRTEMMDI